MTRLPTTPTTAPMMTKTKGMVRIRQVTPVERCLKDEGSCQILRTGGWLKVVGTGLVGASANESSCLLRNVRSVLLGFHESNVCVIAARFLSRGRVASSSLTVRSLEVGVAMDSRRNGSEERGDKTPALFCLSRDEAEKCRLVVDPEPESRFLRLLRDNLCGMKWTKSPQRAGRANTGV
jgi:hypothetical protein